MELRYLKLGGNQFHYENNKKQENHIKDIHTNRQIPIPNFNS